MRRPALVGGLRNALKQAIDAESYTQIPEAANNYIVYDRNKKM